MAAPVVKLTMLQNGVQTPPGRAFAGVVGLAVTVGNDSGLSGEAYDGTFYGLTKT
jgi:hypothetical protein